MTAAKKLPEGRTLTDADVRAIAVATADELEARRSRPRTHPEDKIKPTETDHAAMRKLLAKMNLRPRRT